MELLTRHLQSISDAIDFAFMDQWLAEWIDIPICAAGLYLVMVLWVPENFMKDRQPYNLKLLNTLWNLGLTAFSFVGAYYCVPRLFEMVFADSISGLEPSSLRFTQNMTASMRRNIVIPENFVEGGDIPVIVKGSLDTSMCVWKDDMYRRGITGLMTLSFMFSKIPEMLDTAFLVFQKKHFTFLHWYHHTSVMLYCWHAWITPSSSAIWYAVMNFCVHSLMYLYYLLCSLGYRKHIVRFAPTITFLQIAQMFVGSFICIYVFARYAWFGGCDCSPSNAKLALAMYGSYLYLFSEYYVKRYVLKTSVKGEEDKRLKKAKPSTKKNGHQEVAEEV